MFKHYCPQEGNAKGTSLISFCFQKKLLSLTNFTTTTQLIVKKLYKEKKRKQGLSFRDILTILIIGHSSNMRRRKYRKQANKIKEIRKQLPSRPLQYLQCIKMVYSGFVGLPQLLTFTSFIDPLVALSTIYSPPTSLLNTTYCTQPLQTLYNCCLPYVVVPFIIQTSTFKFNPFLLPYIDFYLLMVARNLLL